METIRTSKENFYMRHATKIAVVGISIIMLMAALIFTEQDKHNIKSREMVEHTYEVRNHLNLLVNNIKEAEIGRRGYIITGNELFLDPYIHATKDNNLASVDHIESAQSRSISQEIAVVRRLTQDNPSQQRNLDELEVMLGNLLSYMAETIEEKRIYKNKPIDKIRFYHGREMLNQVRSMIRIMEAEESHLLALRREAEDLSAKQSSHLIIFSMLAFYLVMIAFIVIYQKTRARAAEQLLRYTRELERREEELKVQQEELKASNEEIEAANEEMEEKNEALEEQNARIQQQAQALEESKLLIEEKISEVERASKYKSEFLANMSHELRTPLNSLLILAKLLAANEEGNLTAEQIEEAQVIYNGGLELLGLINDILDLSKVEAGKFKLHVEEVSLQGIKNRLQQQFEPVAKDKKLAFPVIINSDMPDMMRTDSQRVEQIVKNLLSNAFKFTNSGAVTLEIRRPKPEEMHRDTLDAASAICFSVIDTGIGIGSNKLKDIFEAFQQEDGSVDRHYGGTGLGLTIARKFAHMLGGEIHVTSEKGKGSQFTLILPMRLSAPLEEVYEDNNTSASEVAAEVYDDSVTPATTLFVDDDRHIITEQDKVLLVIEDDANFARTLMKIAHSHHYKCIIAGDGKSGLVLALEYKVTAIILDLKLPDMRGMHVLSLLKHDLRTRSIPVHIISGYGESEADRPLKKGAIGYLSKPAHIDAIHDIFHKVEHMLEKDVKQLLVVEDDMKTQKAIHSLLTKKDVRIVRANTGEEGLNFLKQEAFDCVILDLQLPDMTGFAWLEALEREHLEDAPPIIVYTARDLSEQENRQLEQYSDSIIIKGEKSQERLLDEVTLFLHSVESTLSRDQQEIIRMQHDPDSVLQGRHILLVDDDLRNTFALSKVLKKHGMLVNIADNGQMALDKLKQDPSIELVIMDIMMPMMDGYQAMREIRSIKTFRTLPVIALTARAMPEEQEKCMAAGANDYMVKPVEIDHLLTLLRVWLFKQEVAA